MTTNETNYAQAFAGGGREDPDLALDAAARAALARLEVRYPVTVDQADRPSPPRLIAEVMRRGPASDLETLIEVFGEERLRLVFQAAWAGIFSIERWTWWRRRLGIAAGDPGEPPVPKFS